MPQQQQLVTFWLDQDDIVTLLINVRTCFLLVQSLPVWLLRSLYLIDYNSCMWHSAFTIPTLGVAWWPWYLISDLHLFQLNCSTISYHMYCIFLGGQLDWLKWHFKAVPCVWFPRSTSFKPFQSDDALEAQISISGGRKFYGQVSICQLQILSPDFQQFLHTVRWGREEGGSGGIPRNRACKTCAGLAGVTAVQFTCSAHALSDWSPHSQLSRTKIAICVIKVNSIWAMLLENCKSWVGGQTKSCLVWRHVTLLVHGIAYWTGCHSL